MPKTFSRKISVPAEVTARTHYGNPNLNGDGGVIFYARLTSLAPNGSNIVLGDDVRGWRVGPIGPRIEALAGLALRPASNPQLDYGTRCQDQRIRCRSACRATGTTAQRPSTTMTRARNVASFPGAGALFGDSLTTGSSQN